VKTFDYPEGGVNSHSLKFPDRGQLKNLVLKRGVTASFELFDWFQDIQNGVFGHANQRALTSSMAGSASSAERKIGIALVDAAGEVLKEWKLKRVFPVKWVGPEFKASDSAVAFEAIELAHEGIERVD
jgi:phage tail-like protein